MGTKSPKVASRTASKNKLFVHMFLIDFWRPFCEGVCWLWGAKGLRDGRVLGVIFGVIFGILKMPSIILAAAPNLIAAPNN